MRTALNAMEVYNMRNGKFAFEIYDDEEDYNTHVFLTYYEFAKFMYLLECRAGNQEIDRRISKTITLKETYVLDGVDYECKLRLDRQEDNIIINVHYSEKWKKRNIVTPINDENESDLNVIITTDEAEQLIDDYLEFQYIVLQESMDN